MTNKMIGFGFAMVAVVLVGCSGGDDGGSDKKDVKPVATSNKPTEPPVEKPADPKLPEQTAAGATCSLPGDKGNSLGVGSFCAKGDKCGGGDMFCTADFAAPEGAQFCTLFCASDADCGPDATCYKEARGQACVLKKCLAQ